MCDQHVVDLTLDCSFACIYCPFADRNARAHGVDRPTAVDCSRLEELTPPAAVFLSPASDAFAPQAAGQTHALLEAWLPRGTKIGILTKGMIPRRTLDLLAEFRDQIEGIAIGVTSLDERRNRSLEPGSPPATERLRNVDRAAARGLIAGVRLDPLFPEVDDAPEAMDAIVAECAQRGGRGIIATYVFAWGRYLKRLRREPVVAPSIAHLTEVAPMAGGVAYSVPLARKLETYSFLAERAHAHGLTFGTCGCKDLRLAELETTFYLRCRWPAYLPAEDTAGFPAP
jgi:DNA repair photolyase